MSCFELCWFLLSIFHHTEFLLIQLLLTLDNYWRNFGSVGYDPVELGSNKRIYFDSIQSMISKLVLPGLV